MMFVTAHDSARVEDKRGTSDFVANGAEEWLREEVVVAAGEVGVEETRGLISTLSHSTLTVGKVYVGS